MTAGQAWRAPDGRFFIEADTADGVTCFFSIDPDPRITLLRLTADGITDFGLSPQSGGIRPETARSTANALAKAANRQGHHGVPVVNLKTIFRGRAREDLARRRYLYFPDDSHWNGAGIDLAVQQLESVLPCTQGTEVNRLSRANGASPGW